MDRLAAVARAYGADERWLRLRVADYFGTLDFANRRVLEIGAGNGLYACSVAALGAEEVVALEPELAGSSGQVVDTFRRRTAELGLQSVRLRPEPLEAVSLEPESFDLVAMIASINHLDEERVRTLHEDEQSREVFRRKLRPVLAALVPGGRLVAADASRFHAWQPLIRLGLLRRHPLAPQMEWEKHQPPKVWKALLEEVGFVSVRHHWATNHRYRWMPRPLVDNALAAHLYLSLFVIHADRPANAA